MTIPRPPKARKKNSVELESEMKFDIMCMAGVAYGEKDFRWKKLHKNLYNFKWSFRELIYLKTYFTDLSRGADYDYRPEG